MSLNIQISMTLQEILDSGAWDRFCDYQGWEHDVLQTGQASPDDEVSLSTDECSRLGIKIRLT